MLFLYYFNQINVWFCNYMKILYHTYGGTPYGVIYGDTYGDIAKNISNT